MTFPPFTKVVILGAGGFAREVFWLIQEIHRHRPGLKAVGFIANDSGSSWSGDAMGLPVLGDDEWAFENLDPQEVLFACAIGDSEKRKALTMKYQAAGFRPATLVHPSAQYSEHIRIGIGSILCAGVVATTQVNIGGHVILNLNCTVGHDTNIGDFTTVHPGVNISGNVTIGPECELGSGCTLIPGVTLGSNVKLGAGAVVTNDLPDNCTAVGMPAKPIS